MKKTTNTLFWLYTALVAITILNDRLSFMNIFFSLVYIPFCFLYAVKDSINKKSALLFFLFTLVYIINVICSPIIPNSLNSKWGMLNWEAKVMLTFFPAFYFSRHGLVTNKAIIISGYILFGIAFLSYFLNIRLILLNIDVDEGGVTNNVGYLFVSILPLLFINIRKNIILIILTYIFILLCLKRGAILCGLVTVPILLQIINKNFKINKTTIGVTVVIITVTLGYFIQEQMHESQYVAKRIEQTLEGNTSGRDNMVSYTFNAISNFDVEEVLFGKGINYSMKILGNYTHNDWLELLTSTGIIGCFFYFLTFLGMYYCCKRYCVGNYRKLGYLIILIAFIRSLISMNYFSLDSIPLYYTLGLLCFKRNNYV